MNGETIGILTDDPVLYGEISSFLTSKGVPIVSLTGNEKIPKDVRAVVTSYGEENKVSFPTVISARRNLMVEMWILIQVMTGQSPPDGRVTIGIDPGPRPGFAVVVDDEKCIASGVVSRPEEVAALGRSIRERFPHWRTLKFRVGNGDHVHQARIVNSLLPLGLPVEVVDEHGTTPHGMRNNDEISAVFIAMTGGRRLRYGLKHSITEREARNAQRLSREYTGGKYTIPKELATKVLEGEMTFPEALESVKGHKTLGPKGASRMTH